MQSDHPGNHIHTDHQNRLSRSYLYICSYTHICIYAYDNNFKRCYQLEGGMERLEGGTWRVWKEGGKRRKWHIPISIKDILKAFKMPGIFPPDFKHSYPITLHPSPFQSAKPYFQILRAIQTSNDIFRLYILYVYYTKHLSPCSVLSISICTRKALWKTQNGFPTQLTQDFTLPHMFQSGLYWPPNKLAALVLRLPVLQHFPLQGVFLTWPLLPSPRMDVAVNMCAI